MDARILHNDKEKTEMKKASLLSAFVLLGLLAGCATTLSPINTASGKPEITICKTTKEELMDFVVERTLTGGGLVRKADNYQVVVGAPIDDNLIASILLGSKYDTTPEGRLVWTFVKKGEDCVYISVNCQIVTNPGSAFERVRDISKGGDAHEIQKGLEEMKIKIESGQKR